jgi:hypothetical protein
VWVSALGRLVLSHVWVLSAVLTPVLAERLRVIPVSSRLVRA